jgi:hypothetical protein
MTPAERAHLLSLYDALYQGLGEAAPTFTNDALVVRAHELSRLFGAAALPLRSDDEYVEPSAPVLAMLSHASAEDESGALALFVVTMLLSPRLLIWLRDVAEVEPDELVNAGQELLVTSMHQTGAVLATQPPLEGENLEGVVQSYLEMLDSLGWGEHLGPRWVQLS